MTHSLLIVQSGVEIFFFFWRSEVVPEVGVAFVVLLRVAFAGRGRLLDSLFHSLVPEAHVRVVGVAPDTAGV